MADYFFVRVPSVGQIGNRSEFDRPTAPRQVTKLHCLIDFDVTSDLMRVPPCFIGTRDLAVGLAEAECSGIVERPGQFEASDAYVQFYGSRPLPILVWLDVTGKAGREDFGYDRGVRLIVSEKAKSVIEKFRTEGITFESGEKAPSDEEIARRIWHEAQATAEETRRRRRRD